jgi:predicted component of type VI protein secretion system
MGFPVMRRTSKGLEFIDDGNNEYFLDINIIRFYMNDKDFMEAKYDELADMVEECLECNLVELR